MLRKGQQVQRDSSFKRKERAMTLILTGSKATLSGLLPIVLLLALASGHAAAQSNNCLSTETIYTCNSQCAMDICVGGGGPGGYCSCGYGECCGHQYESCNASGSCSCVGDGCEGAKNKLKASKDMLPTDDLSFAEQGQRSFIGQRIAKSALDGVPSVRDVTLTMIVYVPDRCTKSYGVIFPD